MTIGSDTKPRAVDLACVDEGGDGVPVLFVHGLGHNQAVWQRTRELLGEHWRTIAVDLRGHGSSPWSPEGCYALEDHAADFFHLVECKGFADVHVVAHSLGGQASLLFAAARPDWIRSLTLVDTGPTIRSEGAAHVLGEIGNAIRVFPDVAAYRKELARIHPFAESRLLDVLAEASLARRLDGRFELALDPGVIGSDDENRKRAAAGIEAKLWSAFRALDRPMLVARGQRSSILTEGLAANLLEGAAGRARLVEFADAGHSVMIDASDAFAKALAAFLGEVDEERAYPSCGGCKAAPSAAS